MNELKVFKFEANEVRTVMINGEPWFVLKDVCEVLSISDHKQVIGRLDDDEVGRFDTPHPQSPTKTIEMVYVNESGLYSVIMRSDKPQAKPFRKWVTGEVLPSIRKHGAYITEPKLDELVANPDLIIELATKLKEERAAKAVLQEEKEILEIAIDASLQWCTTMKYNVINRMGWDLLKTQAIGKQMTALCRSKGIKPRKCLDDGGKYGATNSYPMWVWDEFMKGGRY